MATLFGRTYTKRQFLSYLGNPSNVAGVTPIEYTQGKAKGTAALEVRTGSGLEFTLLPDKCLDIQNLRFGGITLSQQSKNGLTGNVWGLPIPGEFNSSVSGGMLFTSGLRNAGPDSVDTDGSYHPAHGKIGTTPAENLSARAYWDGDEYKIEVSGTMRESALFGHNLLFHRTITTSLGSNELCITDRLENLSAFEEEFCLLYHFNYGFPFLSEDLKLVFPENEITPRTEEAKAALAEADRMIPPEDDFFEHVFFRKPRADENGFCTIKTENKTLGIGSYISYHQENLPVLTQWKSMRSGDYALGIEPCNMYILGRKAERENGTLPKIGPFETKVFQLKVGGYTL